MNATPRTRDDGRNERQRAEHARQMEQMEQQPRPQRGSGDRRQLLEEKPFDYIERTKPEDPLEGTSHHGQLTRDNVNPNIPSVEPEETGPAHQRVLNPGGIVDPETLGMDQSQQGEVPPEPELQPEQWPSLGLDHTKDGEDQVQEAENRQRQAEEGSGGLGTDFVPSVNEPPGSDVMKGIPEPTLLDQATGDPRQPPDAPPTTPYPEPDDGDDGDDDDEDDPLPSRSELERMTRAELDELAEARSVDISDASNKQDVIDALEKDARKRKRNK